MGSGCDAGSAGESAPGCGLGWPAPRPGSLHAHARSPASLAVEEREAGLLAGASPPPALPTHALPTHTLPWQMRSRRPLWCSSPRASAQRAGCQAGSCGGVKALSSWSVLPASSRSPRAGFSSSTTSSLGAGSEAAPQHSAPPAAHPPAPKGPPQDPHSRGRSHQADAGVGVPGDTPHHTPHRHSPQAAGSGHLPEPQRAVV